MGIRVRSLPALCVLALLGGCVVAVESDPTPQPIALVGGQANCALLGGCDMSVPRTPDCNCYLNADCFGGGAGFRVCMVNPGECIVNNQSSGKINDGLCTFFWWASLQDFDQRLRAGEAYAAYFDALEAAASRGAALDTSAVNAARRILPGRPGEAMETLAASLVILVVGRAEYPPEHPHKRGHYHFPTRDDGTPGVLSYGVARIDQVGAPELAVLSLIGDAVSAFIMNPNTPALRVALQKLEATAPEYGGHGGCQYPHPPLAHHKFDYANQFDCLTHQVVHAVETLEVVAGPQ